MVSALGFWITSLPAATPRAATDRPNILLIMADDVSWEAFSCYGAEDYRTPNLDALAKSGIRFNHCYSTPICTTSRVQIMTGKYNFRNYTHFGYLSPDEKTFGHLMREAGYATAIAGKWQLNGLYNNLPHHQDSNRPRQAGFDESLLWQVTTQKDPKNGGGERFWSPPLEKNGEMITSKENQGKYGPDLLCNFLCDFMERHREEPFFAYYPMVLVHDPFVPTPDTIGDAPRDPSANRQPDGGAPKKANFVAMVQYMDKLVGRMVAKIEALGLSENTIVLFTADNGTNTSITSQWNGQAIQGGKGGMTDMGTHVPLIASWKGTAPVGKVLDDLVDFSDFYPTLAEAAGVEIKTSEKIDGFSFLPQLQGRIGKPREWVFCHYQPYWNKKGGQFVRDTVHKFYQGGRLFRVPEDLAEKNPVAPDVQTAVDREARERLSAILARCPPVMHQSLPNSHPERPIHPDWPNLADPND